MKIYRETYVSKIHENIDRYIFDFNTMYVISISYFSRGITQKDIFIEHEIKYNIQQYSDYNLREIDMKEFPKEHHRKFLEMMFSEERNSYFFKENYEAVPEVINGKIIRY